MRVKIPVSVTLLSLVSLFATTPAFAADATGNINLTIPSQVQYRVTSDGHLVSPSASAMSFENASDFEVRIDAARFAAENGFNIVEDASESRLPNSISIKIGTAGEKMDLSRCVDTKRSVENKLAWTMTTSEVSETAATLPIASEGYASNIESVGTVGSVEWYVVSDTVTNDVYNKLGELRDDVDNIADRIYPVGAVYTSVDSTDPSELFGGTWERIEGKFLLSATDDGAAGGNSNAAIAAGNTGGEASHKLTGSESGNPKLTHSVTQPAFNTPKLTHSVTQPAFNTPKLTHSVTQPVFKLPNHTHSNPGWVVHDVGGWANRWGPDIGNIDTPLSDSAMDTGNPTSLPNCERTTNVGVGDHAAAACTRTTNVGVGDHAAAACTRTTNVGVGDHAAADASSSHNNMPPYLSVYVWKRVA